MPPRHPALSTVRALWLGLDVLTVGLVAFALWRVSSAFGAFLPDGWAPVATAVGLVFLVVYAAGRRWVRVQDRSISAPRRAWWPDGAWILALTTLWAGLQVLDPWALWIAFPLMVLQMHVLGPHRGVVAVVATVALCVAIPSVMLGRTDVGDVLGPTLGGAVAVGVVLGLEALVREGEQRQRLFDELVAARADLAVTERERAVAAERERLAREIHDTLAQGFSAIELVLRVADGAVGRDDDLARASVEQARRTAQDNLAEARRVVRALAPGDLADGSLAAALERVAGRYRGVGGLRVEVSTAGLDRVLPASVETALLRIAQQALANVVQHARASRVTVTVSDLGDAVALDVVDDGVGTGAPAAAEEDAEEDAEADATHGGEARSDGGFGLASMRSRAVELGGSFTVESDPGDGTAVAVLLPVDEPEVSR
ncbi:two-component sensor histidine kinase [Paraoerskovia sediminicola]|uniref:Oxygen sensor histidine kinase NreB n=1 Tax=Paraoerskovia sediminicola TaxID=1138587 RepID=A0ABN6XCI6_9CELL|nr:sensor histidine kinase [Paraoerskovia sediminicola]BDZ41823.1 two-component sensor histidine kinase [Paraoerskovia sediminicola]